MEEKIKRTRVTIDAQTIKEASGVSFRATASIVNKQNGSKQIVAAQEGSNLKHVMYWLKETAANNLKKPVTEIQFIKGDMPEKPEKPKKVDPVAKSAVPIESAKKPDNNGEPMKKPTASPVPPPPSPAPGSRIN